MKCFIYCVPFVFVLFSSGMQAAEVPDVIEVPHGNGICSAAFSPDGKYILTTGQNMYDYLTARIGDAESGQLWHTLGGHDRDAIMHASFSLDGTRIVTQSDGFVFRIWDW